ncbi:MAG: DNA mismatch repair protein MutS [Bacteroidetes bacterium]|nr:DNA mismatch repair protein MutS [Bacteroidota bacterium]
MSSSKDPGKETPLMKQYYGVKAQHPDALVLFRVGDFYETFGEDAIKTAGILGITLTRRANGVAAYIELAGFPYHSLDTYLPRLITAGQRVAICEQLEDPKTVKTIVKRGVTELVTPGTSLNEKTLEHDKNNYLAALQFGKDIHGLALLDLSTGEFFVTEGNHHYINKTLQSFKPAELLYSKAKQDDLEKLFNDKYYSYHLDDWIFTRDYGYDKLKNHFKTQNLKGYGIEEMDAGIIAAGVVIHYLNENKHQRLAHISRISRIEPDKYVWLDKFTIRNLELLFPAQGEGKALFDILHHTQTPMGTRMLKRWIVLPLRDINPIQERLNLTQYFYQNTALSDGLRQELNQIGDLERLISRISLQRTNPREVKHLGKVLSITNKIKDELVATKDETLIKFADLLNPCPALAHKLETTLVDDPPVQLIKGSAIRKDISAELDEWREIAYSGKDYLLNIQKREIEKTGITSLKIGYTTVFGYYLEVTHAHKDKVPQEWIRKQTLVNAERYITEELKGYEEKILQAEDKIIALEKALFDGLVEEINSFTNIIQMNAETLARLDCHLSFAHTAHENKYAKPELNSSLILNIKDGRHPVIERSLPIGEAYVPNDIYLDNDTLQMVILTGPNMSGKSAILRQTALIVLMAQMGSFVPAASASIGLIDKIFTRVGASDNLSVGESTFMVEMTEAANILNNISQRSLIILDEIGRGTSTYDGISIAWAITEYLHNHAARPKTLFATHYHELNEIAHEGMRIGNFHVSVKEINDKVIFLRKLVAGGSEHSFGIHVAQMAGIPNEIVLRANDILAELEEGRQNINDNNNGKTNPEQPAFQLKMFDYDDPIATRLKKELQETDINSMTPVEALMKLNQLKGMLKK